MIEDKREVWTKWGGVPLADIARHLGHTNPVTTYKFYLRPSVEARRAVGKMLLDMEKENE